MCAFIERMEPDDFVDTIDELRPEMRAKRVLIAQVRRHHDYGVGEVDNAPLAVGQATVIEQLEHDIQHFGMRLFDFVEEHDGVRTAPDRSVSCPASS
jgi:hypothetical protein